jgi:hypothetical protein
MAITTLRPLRPRRAILLRKDAQLGLFGGETEVKPTAAAKRRERMLQPKAPPKPPKPSTRAKKPKEGDTRINRAGNEEVLRAGRWRLASNPKVVAKDKGSAAIVPVVEAEKPMAEVDEDAIAVPAEVVDDAPKPTKLGDRIRAIANDLRDENDEQKKIAARILGAAAQMAQNYDNLVGEVVDMVGEDLGEDIRSLNPDATQADVEMAARDGGSEPSPTRLADKMKAIANDLRNETNEQVKATARILDAAAQIAQNYDNLVDEVAEMVGEDLEAGGSAIGPAVEEPDAPTTKAITTLRPLRPRRAILLRKDAQFDLFGGQAEVKPTATAKRRERIAAGWGAKPKTQLGLFGQDDDVPATKGKVKPKAPKAPVAPKVPEVKAPEVKAPATPKAPSMAAKGPKEGDTRINRAGNQEVLRAGRWRLASNPKVVAKDKGSAAIVPVVQEIKEEKPVEKPAAAPAKVEEAKPKPVEAQQEVKPAEPTPAIAEEKPSQQGLPRVTIHHERLNRFKNLANNASALPPGSNKESMRAAFRKLSGAVKDEDKVVQNWLRDWEKEGLSPDEAMQRAYRYGQGLDPVQSTEAPATPATPEQPATESGPTLKREIPLDQFKGKGWTPALSVKAFDGENPLWFSQLDPGDISVRATVTFNGEPPALGYQKLWAAIKAAKADGFKLEYYKAGKYSGVRVLERNGNALTAHGLRKLYGGPTPEDYQKPGVIAGGGDRAEPALLQPKVAEPEPTAPEQPAAEPTPAIAVDTDFASTKQQKQRIKINQDVEALLSQKPDGPYTKDELILLAKYSGKGGITEDDGSLSEYYTRPDVAKHLTNVLYQHGFKGGAVLEPSCGNGVFLHQFKDDPNVLPVGVELSETSGKAAAALNPHAEVTAGASFERFCLDNPDFSPDAVIGNVPFGTRTVGGDLEAFRKVGKGWKDNGDFFVHESLSRLKPGGIMALIVPHGITTGSTHQRLREELMKQGRVIGVHRLPNTAFAHTNTKTITDVLVIQKHPDAILNAIADGQSDVIAKTRDDAFIHGKYFEAHPEHVLGEYQETSNQFGGKSFTINGKIEDALASAQGFTPDVSYDGLQADGAEERSPQKGDTRYINGRLYRLEGDPARWHLVEQSEPVAEEVDASGYGADSMADAEAQLLDAGRRVLIHPDNLQSYRNLAHQHLPKAEAMAFDAAIAASNAAGSSIDREKLAHAMLLADHIERLQKGDADPMQVEKALNMLQGYREAHGNPSTDKTLIGLSSQFPALLRLQGCFDENDKISDYFTDHDKVTAQVKRTHSEAGAAMAEAYRAAGGEAVDLDMIRAQLDTTMTDADLEATLVADPTVGYINGAYMPMDRLLTGNGFNLVDAMLMEAEGLPEGAAARRKLEEQIGIIRSRLEPRQMEDITTPFWAVGSWIPVDAINAFLTDRDYGSYSQGQREPVKIYRGADGKWRVSGYAYGVVEDVITSMNRGRISHGKNTQEAKEAVQALEKDFAQWIAGSDYRVQVEEAYNLAFNSDLPEQFSGDPIDISLLEQYDADEATGKRKKRLHDYQTSTIRQMAAQGRGIIALGVGLGKTATSIGLALHLKESGRAKKPTFVVPKSVLSNWVREVGFWAPQANVMILGQTQRYWADDTPMWEVPGFKIDVAKGVPKRDKDGNYILYRQIGERDVTTKGKDGKTITKKEKVYADQPILMSEKEYLKAGNLVFSDDDAATKRLKLRQLSQNNYDMVLMTEPTFQALSLHPDKETEYLEDITQDAIGHLSDSSKDTHKMLEKIEKRRVSLAARTDDNIEETITFEELGIDALFHDEAHHLKNLYGSKRNQSLAFMSQAESNRSLDFYYKARYIREMNNNQNVYLLTATPTTNNPLEAFNMLQHVCPEELEKRGIQNIDDFLGMFGDMQSVEAPGVDGEIKEKYGLVGFKNLKDLRHLFNKYCRMQSAKDVGLPIPEEATQHHYVSMSPAQKELYNDLRRRARNAGSDKGPQDHLFSVISDMDKAVIDLAYYNESGSGKSPQVDIPEGEKPPKVQACIEQVMSSRNANQGKQIVFCDSVQMHQRIKQQLVEAGYPEDQIAIVNADVAKNSPDRQKISNAYNEGRITLVIGNTATMGEGMNFQIGTTDIHHLTTPWTPAAIEQRNGRGVRQGNVLDNVGCHYYHAKGSFDQYRQQTLERKRGWIDDLWKGSEDTASNQDTGLLNADEIDIMLADDPEAARAAAEANQELALDRHRKKMTTAALRDFAQLQNMRLVVSKMTPEARSRERGRALEARLRQVTEALSRNEYFPHKHLLDGTTPAYIGSDGTVLQEGDHVRQDDGSIYQITKIDNAKSKFVTQMVSGPDYNPSRLSEKGETFDFKHVNSTKSRLAIAPTSFNERVHADRVIDSLSAYGAFETIASLSPDAINENRGRIMDRLKNDLPSASMPYLDPETDKLVLNASVSEMPANAQVLWPHDGESVEIIVKKMAEGTGAGTWKFESLLQRMTGRSWSADGLGDEIKARVEEYKQQNAVIKEQGPKAGDTRVNEAGHQEVLRDGRWRRVDEADTPTPQPNAAHAEGLTTEQRLALAEAIKEKAPANWRGDQPRERQLSNAVFQALGNDVGLTVDVMERIKRSPSDEEFMAALTAVAEPEATTAEPDAPAVESEPKQARSPRLPESEHPPHPDPLGAIRDALERIQADDDVDGGVKRNGMGWNYFTRKLGSSLAYEVMGGNELTPRQYYKAWELLTKRHRPQAGEQATADQLSSTLKEMFGWDGIEYDSDGVEVGATGKMRLVGDEIHINRPYNKADLDKFRRIPGRRWDGQAKANVIPVQRFREALEQFPEEEMDIDPAIFDHPGIQADPDDIPAGTIQVKDGEFHITFPYDQELVARVKGIKQQGRQLGKWDGAKKVWRFPGSREVEDLLTREFSDFQLKKAAKRYSLAGVIYELRRTASNAISLVRVHHA